MKKATGKTIIKSKKAVIIFSMIAAVFLVSFLLLRFTPYSQLDSFLNQTYSTRIYDRNDQLLQILPVNDGLRREWTSLKEIPEEVQAIFLQAEDKRFFVHQGIDFVSTVAALFQNLKYRRTVRGASTITMQLVKIIDSKNGLQNKSTFAKKISDAINALRLESRLSKKQILELYLNTVPFGTNIEGVTSAARSFFGKSLTELTTDQIKCLSVIPRRPGYYNPVLNPKACAERAGVSLEVAESAEFYEYPFYFPHYIEYVKSSYSDLPFDLELTVDLRLQNKCEDFLRTAMIEASDARIANGSVVVLDNFSGEILAWVGNNNWYDSEHHGQLDGVITKNQPGSSMKPFLYALALDERDSTGKPQYLPSSIIADIPREFGTERLYIPANFNNRFNGPVRFRIALASSLNIPAVSLLDQVGVDKYLDKLFELGFDSLKYGGKEADLGLSLGAGEVTLQELVKGFSVFVRDGKDFDGNQIYSIDTARLICSILSDSAARALGFGYTQSFQTDYPSIFKTGTANQYQNIVALGATKEYTVGVWMGNFEGQTVVGKTGSSLPARVAKQILDLLEENKPIENLKFPEPEHWHKQRICPVSGMKASKNCISSVMEYVYDDMQLDVCNWHKNSEESGIYTVYPPEYQKWVIQNNIDVKLDYNAMPLKIESPNNGALFYYSGRKSEKQAIQVDVTGGSEEQLSVYYDDEFYNSVQRPFIFLLPVERGKHQLVVICGNNSESIEFEVR